MPERDLITAALLEPAMVSLLSSANWDLLIRQGRRANLLATLAFRLSAKELLLEVPVAPRQHLISAQKIADRQSGSIRWEVSCISKALQDCGVKAILLKGAAYVMADVDAAQGRTFSDIDILVPKVAISEVENALLIHGWQGGYHDAYDQRYYRQWMHEIPPLMHIRRGTTIDVHHTILPETARIKVNTEALFEDPVRVSGFENIFVLKPVDMLLHSATHLFHEGEFDNGLRDLFDLDALVRQFGESCDLWRQLRARANELGLERPLYYALTCLREFLATPMPVEIGKLIDSIAPNQPVRRIMQVCYRRALRPNHASCHSRGTWGARKLLYIRSHWIKMPLPLLVYHLGRKALIRPELEKTLEPAAKENP